METIYFSHLHLELRLISIKVTKPPSHHLKQKQDITESHNGKVWGIALGAGQHPAALTMSKMSFSSLLALPFRVGFIFRQACPKQWQKQLPAALVLCSPGTERKLLFCWFQLSAASEGYWLWWTQVPLPEPLPPRSVSKGGSSTHPGQVPPLWPQPHSNHGKNGCCLRGSQQASTTRLPAPSRTQDFLRERRSWNNPPERSVDT